MTTPKPDETRALIDDLRKEMVRRSPLCRQMIKDAGELVEVPDDIVTASLVSQAADALARDHAIVERVTNIGVTMERDIEQDLKVNPHYRSALGPYREMIKDLMKALTPPAEQPRAAADVIFDPPKFPSPRSAKAACSSCGGIKYDGITHDCSRSELCDQLFAVGDGAYMRCRRPKEHVGEHRQSFIVSSSETPAVAKCSHRNVDAAGWCWTNHTSSEDCAKPKTAAKCGYQYGNAQPETPAVVKQLCYQCAAGNHVLCNGFCDCSYGHCPANKPAQPKPSPDRSAIVADLRKAAISRLFEAMMADDPEKCLEHCTEYVDAAAKLAKRLEHE